MINKTYISSAILSFGRIEPILNNAKKFGMYSEYLSLIRSVLNHINNYSTHCGHGVMWNALTERPYLKEIVKDDDIIVQADSGGLQVVTRGLGDDAETKLNVYKNQLDECDYAMSFDKMPIKLRDDASGLIKMNHSTKIFVRELIYPAGRESGFNIKTQIETFIESNTKTKIMIILQGYELEEYNEYARGVFSVFNEMPKSLREKYYKHIAGISLGTTAVISYFNMLDMFCRAPVDLSNVPERFCNMIHILALGGMSKLGVIFALNDDFFGKDVHYTFDSTSMVSAPTFGKYTEISECREGYRDTSSTSLGYEITESSIKFTKEMQDVFEDIICSSLNIPKMTETDFRNTFSPFCDDLARTKTQIIDMYCDTKTPNEMTKMYTDRTLVNHFLHFSMEFMKNMDMAEDITNNNYNSISDSTLKRVIKKLKSLKNHSEYMKNREWFKLVLEGKRESSMEIVDTLDDFNRLNEGFSMELDEW